MKSSVTNLVMALGLVAIGVAIGAADIYIGDTMPFSSGESWDRSGRRSKWKAPDALVATAL